MTQASAQQNPASDSTAKGARLSAIRFGADIIQPIKTFAKHDFSGWEVSADAEIKHYYPTLELGRWSRDVELSNGQYTNKGAYWRVGVDLNLLKKDKVKNMFFLGIRYGHTRYDEQLSYTITTDVFEPVQKSVRNNNLKSGWLEGTVGMRVKIARGFWMGYTGRIKFAAAFNEDDQLQSYDMPGYGLTFKQPWWGFNYYLMWKIDFAGR